jgi:hypothetical protein
MLAFVSNRRTCFCIKLAHLLRLGGGVPSFIGSEDAASLPADASLSRDGLSKGNEQRHNFEVAVLRRRKPTKAVIEAAATEASDASSIRRPGQIQFATPSGHGRWRMTGRLNWPSRNQGIAPLCEWINNEGPRMWLYSELKDLALDSRIGQKTVGESWSCAAGGISWVSSGGLMLPMLVSPSATCIWWPTELLSELGVSRTRPPQVGPVYLAAFMASLVAQP